MKKRPILMSAPMVKAILNSTKTQTRRVVKPQPSDNAVRLYFGHIIAHEMECSETGGYLGFGFEDEQRKWQCPYGKPGDHLWVKETCVAREQDDGLDGVQYLSDMGFREIENTRAAADAWVKLNHYGGRGKAHVVPSIHMPRWASRITLEITEVRVERLNDISLEDAYDEGAADWASETVRDGNKYSSAIRAYQALWGSINGAGSWDLNPFCWVLVFRRINAS